MKALVVGVMTNPQRAVPLSCCGISISHHLFSVQEYLHVQNVRAYIAGIVGRRTAGCLYNKCSFLQAVLCSPPKPGPTTVLIRRAPAIDALTLYQDHSPNGGEGVHVGDQCTLKVRSRYPVSSTLVLSTSEGKVCPRPPAYVPLGGGTTAGRLAAGAAGDSTIMP